MQAPVEEPTSGAPRAAAEVLEAQPPVLYLRSADGKVLQEILNFTLDDFSKLMAQRAQQLLGREPPAYRIDRLEAELDATGDGTLGRLRTSIELAIRSTEWVRVPLGLGDLVLVDKASHTGPSEFILEFDHASGQHVVWLRGGGDAADRIELVGLLPIAREAGGARISVDFPRSASSRLVVSAAGEAQDLDVAGAAIEQTAATESGIAWTLIGLGDRVVLAWGDGASQPSMPPATIEAKIDAVVRIDGRAVRCDPAEITVQSLQGSFDRFRILLPSKVRWQVVEQPGLLLREVRSDGDGVELEATLTEMTAGPTIVRLWVEELLSTASDEGSQRGVLPIPVVVDAARQSGATALVVQEEWDAVDVDLIRARETPLETLPEWMRRDSPSRAFERFAGDARTEIELRRRRPTVSVEPRFRAEVSLGRVQLDAEWRVRVRGGKVATFDVAIPGWGAGSLVSVGPGEQVAFANVAVVDESAVRIPLRQPVEGETTVQLRLSRPIPADAARIEFDLPRLAADVEAAAELETATIGAARLAPRDAECRGLVRRLAATSPAAGAAGSSLTYAGTNAVMKFVADLLVEEAEATADVDTRIVVSRRSAEVVQRFTLRVRGEPLDQIAFRAPAELPASGVVALVDDVPVAIAETEADAPEAQSRDLVIRLAEPTLRDSLIELRYSWPLTADGVDGTVETPLLACLNAEVDRNALRVEGVEGTSVEVRDSRWTSGDATASGAAGDPLTLTAADAPESVGLLAAAAPSQSEQALRVERTWLQTALAPGRREDRAVFLIRGGGDRLSLSLPSNALAALTFVDGRPVKNTFAPNEDRCEMSLPAAVASDATRTVEVRLRTELPADDASAHEPPRIAGAVWTGPTYWQLMLPADEYLLVGPTNMSHEFAWRWSGVGWSRKTTLDDRQLERWSRAAAEGDAALSQTPAPLRANRYLFSSLGPAPALQMNTVHRSTLVFWASGGALAVGLALIYAPRLRRPNVLFIGAVIGGAAALAFGPPAVILLQASALGLLLVAVALAMKRSLWPRPSAAGFANVSAGSASHVGSTRTHARSPSSVSVALDRPFAGAVSNPEGEP